MMMISKKKTRIKKESKILAFSKFFNKMADNFLTKKRTNILFFKKLDPLISEDLIFRNFWKKNPLFCKKILFFIKKDPLF